ncbi:MAG: hypothetical protein WCP20_20215 [Desulfuromonadales bacterium]
MIPASQQNNTDEKLPVSGADLSALLICFLFLIEWNIAATNRFSGAAVLLFAIISTMSYATGTLILLFLKPYLDDDGDFPLRFSLGFFSSTIMFYLLVLILPFSIWIDYTLIIIAVAGLLLFWRGKFNMAWSDFSTGLTGFFCVLICFSAVTFWLKDAFSPAVSIGNKIIVKTWIDSFYHSAQIRAFSEANGANTIQDLRLAGIPTFLYHYASYVLPALVRLLTRTTSLEAYTSFLLPVGLTLTGLSGFSLIRSWWGEKPALIAVIALMLLPDAAQHGMQNYYYSYHWLQTVAPGGMYGVAAIGLAWLLMIRACQTGLFRLLLASYLLALVAFCFKAQFVVANAFLLWTFPIIFWPHIETRKRVALFAIFLAIFQATVYFAGFSNSIPTLKTDSSALQPYLVNLKGFFLDNDWILPFVPDFAKHTTVYNLFWGGVLIFLVTFGVYGILFIVRFVMSWRDDKSSPITWFPVLVLINFLFMTLMLAYDTNGFGTEDELIHRPFVWAYFALVTWTFGAIGKSISHLLTIRYWQATVALFSLLLMPIPLYFANTLQEGPPKSHKIWANFEISPAELHAFDYVSRHAGRGDIIQDSANDPLLMFSALSEKQLYLCTSIFQRQLYLKNQTIRNSARLRPEESIRWGELTRFKKMTEQEQIISFAKNRKIKWYLLYPDDHVDWPAALLEKPVFTEQGIRLYHFD